MSVKERLIIFIKYKKMSQNKFEKAVGLSNGYINNISKGLGADKLQMISLYFPDLNTGWLLTGEGEMLKKQYMGNSLFFSGDGNNNSGNSIQGGGGIHYKTTPGSFDENTLLYKIEYLESLLKEKDKQLAEKERLIEILMKK